MACECKLVTGLAVGREHQGAVGTKVGNPAVSKLIKIFSRFSSGKQVIIINIDSLVGILCRFSNQNI